jgi:hypothetical protein
MKNGVLGFPDSSELKQEEEMRMVVTGSRLLYAVAA